MNTYIKPALLTIVLAAMFVFAPVNAQAQRWDLQPNTTPVTTYNLPYSVTFDFYGADGWNITQGMTWNPIGTRNLPGSWYRPQAYTQINAWKTNLFPYDAYSCRSVGGGFICRDLLRNVDRKINCPTSLYIGPLKMWRSTYNGAWPEQGLFTANVGAYASVSGKAVAMTGATVTENGRRANCLYGPLTQNGAGSVYDIFVYFK